MKQKSDWTPEQVKEYTAAFKKLGGYMEHGTAHFLFCRPTDSQLIYLLSKGLPPPGEDVFRGEHIYSMHWWSGSVEDSMVLARKAFALLPLGAVFATHNRVIRRRVAPCQR